jgi:filamentous hemagglutinin family protein
MRIEANDGKRFGPTRSQRNFGATRPRHRLWLGTVFPGASAALIACVANPASAQEAGALPTGGSFSAGSGVISSSAAGTLSVTQSSSRGIIDWRSFSIGADARVLIDNGAGATLNRVLGTELSRIQGQLRATGSVYLINPNGVVVGSQGSILTGGSFVAFTRDIANDAFMAASTLSVRGSSTGAVVNQGSIVAQHGDVILIGRSVDNTGNVSASNGTASLLAADSVLLTTVGGPTGIYVAPEAAGRGDVTSSGRIEAAAAALKAARGDVYTLAGNRTGLISATGTTTINGEVWLSAPDGTVMAGGTVSSLAGDGNGGRIVANGAHVVVSGDARIAATGARGGSVLLGASAAGGVDLAQSLTLEDGASIRAGGPLGGGFVETSAHRLSMGALAIDAGKGGDWLVDPINLTIDTTAASTITASLNVGTNVTQVTTATTATSAGVQSPGAGDITVAAPLTWSGSGALTLQAYADLNINAAISGVGGFNGQAGGAVT